MIKIGQNKYITDGNEVFSAEESIKHYSKPPEVDEICKEYFGTLEFTKGVNRIDKLEMTFDQFLSYCDEHAINLYGQTATMAHWRPAYLPSSVAATCAYLFGYFSNGINSGAMLGLIVGLIVFFFSMGEEVKEADLLKLFKSVKNKQQEWAVFDEQKEILERKEKQAYLTKAQDQWRRYHKLQLVSNVDEMSGVEFENLLAKYYVSKGYTVNLTPSSGDFGVDLLATKGRTVLAVQAKRYSGSVGVRAVQEVSSGAVYYQATKAAVVTNSFFTRQAKELAKALNVSCVGRKKLLNKLASMELPNIVPSFNLQQYEEMKAAIAKELKRVDRASSTDRHSW